MSLVADSVLKRDCRSTSEEGVDDVKSACPLHPGLHTYYNGEDNEQLPCEGKRISKTSSQFGLHSATRVHEGGIASNRWSAIQR
jgi:hypothetical protein